MAKHLKIGIDKIEFDGDVIIKDINFIINKNDRIALVGSNGAGKTTLLKTLTGENKNYYGNIENVGNLTLGYLHQVYGDDENKTTREELKEGFQEIKKMELALKKAESNMQEDPENIEYIEDYTTLLEQFHIIGGHDYNNKIHGVANGMGILGLLDKKLCEVSGGQRTKIALAKILLESPDILFLDEPTNFIDMTSVEWLENFLQNKWIGGYVIISHDREFLDKTCDKTFEVQPKRSITFYHVDYSQYVIQRDKAEKKKLEEYKREQEFILKEEKLINRFRAGSRAGWAKSRGKSLEKREPVDKPFIQSKPKFNFEFTGDLPDKLISIKEVFIGRDEPLFFIPEAILYKKHRIGIVGGNGVGKSTLLKTIMGQLEILDGHLQKAKGLKISYYSQLHEELEKKLTVRQSFEKAGFHYPDQHLIGLLHHYLFDKTVLDKKVEDLSGGQKSKLLFAILGQRESNILILDEPTNHLDYDTRESLEASLSGFPGSILFISHDRYFVNKLADNIWFIENEELSISYGNYDDYKFKLENNIEMNMNLLDEEAELNLVLEDKLGSEGFKKIKNRFNEKYKKKRRK